MLSGWNGFLAKLSPFPWLHQNVSYCETRLHFLSLGQQKEFQDCRSICLLVFSATWGHQHSPKVWLSNFLWPLPCHLCGTWQIVNWGHKLSSFPVLCQTYALTTWFSRPRFVFQSWVSSINWYSNKDNIKLFISYRPYICKPTRWCNLSWHTA